jgi:hypothetical protein
MLVHAHSFAINRGIAEHVHVELDTRGGLPAFSVIGLGAGAARDARERVQAAVLNSGFGFPRRRVTVNLAPAATRKGGPELDLVLARSPPSTTSMPIGWPGSACSPSSALVATCGPASRPTPPRKPQTARASPG